MKATLSTIKSDLKNIIEIDVVEIRGEELTVDEATEMLYSLPSGAKFATARSNEYGREIYTIWIN